MKLITYGTGRYPTIIGHLPNLRKHLKNNLIKHEVKIQLNS